jgi:hypothetical protein
MLNPGNVAWQATSLLRIVLLLNSEELAYILWIYSIFHIEGNSGGATIVYRVEIPQSAQ